MQTKVGEGQHHALGMAAKPFDILLDVMKQMSQKILSKGQGTLDNELFSLG